MKASTWRPASPEADGPVQPHRPRIAWLIIAVVDLSILIWGILAMLDPTVLTSGFESYTGGSWAEFTAAAERPAAFVLAGTRVETVDPIETM